MNVVFKDIFKTTITNCDFMVIMIKKFKNNIKITIPLKQGWTKNNFENIVTNCGFKENCKTTVIDCDFKDISENFKITVINGGFTHLKKNPYGCLHGCKRLVW